MSIRRLLKLDKGFKTSPRSLKVFFCKSLTEFYQIWLKILPNLTDFSSQLMACMLKSIGLFTLWLSILFNLIWYSYIKCYLKLDPLFRNYVFAFHRTCMENLKMQSILDTTWSVVHAEREPKPDITSSSSRGIQLICSEVKASAITPRLRMSVTVMLHTKVPKAYKNI